MMRQNQEIHYQSYPEGLAGLAQFIHIIRFQQDSEHFSLLLSKVSEAILPETHNNHIGQGASMDEFLLAQPDAYFVINGGFNHYRHDFYTWAHQQFHIGDPVGIVKIREHYFEDYLDLNHYGFLVQKNKYTDWQILTPHEMHEAYQEYKYILGCTPLLVHQCQACSLPEMKALDSGEVNPPSFLGHGLQLHPRTAVGIKEREIYFIIVDGVSGGFTLPQLQSLALNLELEACLNLDGGGSSQFRLKKENHYIQNQVNLADSKRVLGHVLAIFPKRAQDYQI